MKTVSHHGRETAYRLTGDDEDGAPVLYVHGSGATHRLWGRQYGPDGPAYPAVALDLSGHGESDDIEAEPGPETLRSYARDVIAVARETDAETLVGNSLGGAAVLHVALESDFDPSRLVFAGTGAKLAVLDDLREWLASDVERAIDFLHGQGRLFQDVEDQEIARSEEAMRATGQRVTRRDFLTCHQFDVRDRVREITAPSLAIVRSDDGLTPPSYHEYLAEELPNCEYAEIPDAAHLAMVERSRAFNDRVSRFLDEHGLSA